MSSSREAPRTVESHPARAAEMTGLDLRTTVALFVMGYTKVYTTTPLPNEPGYAFGYKTDGHETKIPAYEADLAAAMAVAETMKREYQYAVDISWQGEEWFVKMAISFQSFGLASPTLDKLPETICRVAAYLRWHQRRMEAEGRWMEG